MFKYFSIMQIHCFENKSISMFNFITSIFYILLFILIITPGHTQFFSGPGASGLSVPHFNVELFRTFTEDLKLNRLYFYYEILNDNLTFIKKAPSGFQAKFELISAIYDEDENLLVTKTLYKEVDENDFKETNSRDKKISLRNFYDLPEGEYLLKFKMNDLVSDKSKTEQLEIVIENFQSKKISMSDIIFIQDIPAGDDSTIVPMKFRLPAKNNFPARMAPLYVYFDFLTKRINSEIEIRYELKNTKNKTEIDTTINKKITEPLTGHYFKLNTEDFKGNRYNCIVTVKDTKDKVSRKNNFSFFWIKIPQTGSDLSVALKQMMYILPSDSLDRYENADPEEQKRYFISFWKERDPNPNTEVNELMEEYFRRVNYANHQYKALNFEGWRTDRGRILIKFGDPDDIERHPFEVNSVPYEIWRYYNLRKIFVFVDQSGFGDYRIAPEYLDQEYR